MRKIIGVILLVVVMSACTGDEGCIQDLSMSMKATLYKMTYDNSIEQFVPEIYSRPITLYGVGRDSLLYNNYSTNKLNIPLKKNDSISSFVMITSYNEGDSLISVNDTLDFYHSNKEEFISLECGCIVTNNLTGVAQTTHMIDSIIVESANIDLTSGNNIKIYFKVK